jgi:hypothetical protein
MSAKKAAITVLLPREDVERRWICLFELSSLVMSDPPGKGDFHGDVDAVREKNTEDPHRKIFEGPPAVRRPVAPA